jgi:hypothetical protein
MGIAFGFLIHFIYTIGKIMLARLQPKLENLYR